MLWANILLVCFFNFTGTLIKMLIIHIFKNILYLFCFLISCIWFGGGWWLSIFFLFSTNPIKRSKSLNWSCNYYVVDIISLCHRPLDYYKKHIWGPHLSKIFLHYVGTVFNLESVPHKSSCCYKKLNRASYVLIPGWK